MFTINVLYGAPDDPDAFDAHYRDAHVPIASRLPGLRKYAHGPVSAPERDAPYHYSARLEFDSAADRRAALGSPEMEAAVADVQTFASGGVTIFLTDEVDASL